MRSKTKMISLLIVLLLVLNSYTLLFFVADFNRTKGLQKPISIAQSQNSIEVLSPNSTSIWYTGNSYNIGWNASEDIHNVGIELWEGSDTWYTQVITVSTSNDGNFTWTPGEDLEESDEYRIKIEDSSDSDTYDYSPYFELKTNESITIESPTSASEWEAGTSHTIEWTSWGVGNYVEIELYDGTVKELTIDDRTSNDGSYDWDIPTQLQPGNNYLIKITDTSDSNVYDYSDTLTILEHRTISIISPETNSKINTGSEFEIEWSHTGRISNVDILLYNSQNEKIEDIEISLINDGNYQWQVPHDLDSGEYYITIVDSSDDSVKATSGLFQINNILHSAIVIVIVISIIAAIGLAVLYLYTTGRFEKLKVVQEKFKEAKEIKSLDKQGKIKARVSKIDRTVSKFFEEEEKKSKIERKADDFVEKLIT